VAVKTFTDVGIAANQIVDQRERGGEGEELPPLLSSGWEGPWFPFSVLLGVGPTWGREGVPGLPAWVVDGVIVCGACCRHVTLPPSTYCINCDRSGKEAEIGKPTELDIARRKERRKYTPPPSLAGGKGKPLAGRVKRRAG